MAVLVPKTRRRIDPITSLEDLRTRSLPTEEDFQAFLESHAKVQAVMKAAGVTEEQLIEDYEQAVREARARKC